MSPKREAALRPSPYSATGPPGAVLATAPGRAPDGSGSAVTTPAVVILPRPVRPPRNQSLPSAPATIFQGSAWAPRPRQYTVTVGMPFRAGAPHAEVSARTRAATTEE